MNPGYLSYVSMACFVILMCSGWRIEMVGHINRWMVMIFVGLWLVLMPFSWQVTPYITFHFSTALIISLLMIVCIRLRSRIHLVQLFLFSTIVSIWHGYMVYSQRWSPLYLIHPVLDIALGEAILIGGFIKNPIHQITIVSSGVMVGDLLDQLWNDPLHIQIGHVAAWDHIFIAMFSTRAVALFVQWSRNKLLSR